MKLHELLKQSGLAEGLNEEQLERLAEVAELRSYQPGDTIISETNRSRDLYLVESGTVSVTMCFPVDDAKSETIDRLHPGKVLGEVAFIDGSPRSATVRSEEKSRLYVFSYERLHRMMEEDNAFGYALIRALARILTGKIRQTNLAWRNLMMW